nr:transposase [Streptomyces dysideae]
MTDQALEVTGGVDTHGETHHAAVTDRVGRHLADREFPATGTGYRQLLAWLRSFGTVTAVGVEGTGAYGAELARTLRRAGLTVVEVDRPDRKTRRMKGKSDPIDAYAAAEAVVSGRATGTPKTRDGIVEAVRTLRVVRRSAVKARTQAVNQARQLLVTAPERLRAQLRGLPEDWSEEVRLHVCPDVRLGDVQQTRARRDGARVVDEHGDVRRGGDGRVDRRGVGDVQGQGDDAFIVPGARGTGGGVDLGGAASQGFVDEVGADAAIGAGDEDDCSIERGHWCSFIPRGCEVRGCARMEQ